MAKKDFTTTGSRLDRFSGKTSSEGSIGGHRVSESEDERLAKKVEVVKTSVVLPKELKERTQELAHLKQMSWKNLLEFALEEQLRINADLLAKFDELKR